MRLTLSILLTLFTFNQSTGQGFQNIEIDSLKSIADQVNDEKRAIVYNQLSELYRNTNTERALHYAKEALKLSIANNDIETQIESNINAGVVLRNFGKSDEALNYFFNAIEISSEDIYLDLKADALHKIGVTYLLVNDLDNALIYTQKELQIWQKSKKLSGLADALNLLGLIQINLGEFKTAAENLKKSLEIGYSVEDTGQIYKPLVNLGDLYLKLEQPDTALFYIQKSRDVSLSTGNTYGLAIASLKEGQALKALKSYDIAEQKIRTALINAERLNSLSLVRNCYENLAQLFEESNNYRNALMYYKLYIATEDSMLSEITRRKIAQIETEYKLKEKNTEIAELKELSGSQKFKFAIAISLLVLIIPALYFLYNKLQNNKKVAQKIKSLEKELDTKKVIVKKLSEQEKELGKLKSLLNNNGSEYLNFFSNYFIDQYGDSVNNSIHFHLIDDTFYVLAFSFQNNNKHTLIKSIYLDNIINKIFGDNTKSTLAPSKILTEIEDSLNDFAKYFNARKGKVEASALSININTKRVIYAGAGIPVYTIRHQNLHIVSSNSLSLRSRTTTTESFSNKTFQMNKHEQIFFFLESGVEKSLTEENIRLVLADHDPYNINETKKALIQGLEKWVPQYRKTESTLIFGLEI